MCLTVITCSVVPDWNWWRNKSISLMHYLWIRFDDTETGGCHWGKQFQIIKIPSKHKITLGLADCKQHKKKKERKKERKTWLPKHQTVFSNSRWKNLLNWKQIWVMRWGREAFGVHIVLQAMMECDQWGCRLPTRPALTAFHHRVSVSFVKRC